MSLADKHSGLKENLGGDRVQRVKRLCFPGQGQAAIWSRLFIISAGGLLFITGAAKIASALGKSDILGKPDPIFGIHFNYLLLSVGLIEIVIAVLCLPPNNQNLALGLVAALSLNFLGYRVALWLTHWPGYCPCLGTLTQAIHLSRHHANLLTLIILIYLILGSLAFLARSWRARKGKLGSAPVGGHASRFLWLI